MGVYIGRRPGAEYKNLSISVKQSLNVIFIFFPYELVMSF